MLTAAVPAVAAQPLSTLEPAGVDAERIAVFFWWMGIGAGIVWLAAMSCSTVWSVALM